MEIGDVGVAPGDEVAAEEVEAFPERLALALEGAELGQDRAVLVDLDAEGAGDVDCAVGGAAVDDDDLVQQRVAVDQVVEAESQDPPDGRGLVEGRQREADREALAALNFDEPVEVVELAGVKGVLGEPAVDPGRELLLAQRRLVGGLGRRGVGPSDEP